MSTSPPHEREAAEDMTHLALPAIRIEVVLRGDTMNVGGLVDRAGLHVFEIAARHLGQLFAIHPSSPPGRSTPCGRAEVESPPTATPSNECTLEEETLPAVRTMRAFRRKAP